MSLWSSSSLWGVFLMSMYCSPDIDVDRSSMIRNRSLLHKLQKFLWLSHKHFSHPVKDFTFFITTEIEMISPRVIYLPFFSFLYNKPTLWKSAPDAHENHLGSFKEFLCLKPVQMYYIRVSGCCPYIAHFVEALWVRLTCRQGWKWFIGTNLPQLQESSPPFLLVP